jgi:tRNA modification GTPase
LTGQGLETLTRTIAERLVPDSPPPGAGVPFTQPQIDQLLSARAALCRFDPLAAADLLP